MQALATTPQRCMAIFSPVLACNRDRWQLWETSRWHMKVCSQDLIHILCEGWEVRGSQWCLQKRQRTNWTPLEQVPVPKGPSYLDGKHHKYSHFCETSVQSHLPHLVFRASPHSWRSLMKNGFLDLLFDLIKPSTITCGHTLKNQAWVLFKSQDTLQHSQQLSPWWHLWVFTKSEKNDSGFTSP